MDERELGHIQARVTRKSRPLRGATKIALAVGTVINKCKMAKHFELTITDTIFHFARRAAAIIEEARLDGIYVVRTSLPAETLDDADKAAAEARRKNIVAQAQRSPAAIRKQTIGVTPDGLPVHSLHSLLADLATLARNTIVTAITPNYPLTVLTRPTPIQHKAFALLGLSL